MLYNGRTCFAQSLLEGEDWRQKSDSEHSKKSV